MQGQKTFSDLLGDIFDIRDVIARFETIEHDDDETEEARTIGVFLEEVAGNGGDEQWRGTWYPITFIADHYFETYARDLADDIGAIQRDQSWPYTCIDWTKAADELQSDYSAIEIDGQTYWYR
jgi:hypothetical protein